MTRTQEQILSGWEIKCLATSTTTDELIRNNSGLWCERNFDGLYCWPGTKSGVLAFQNCTNQYVRTNESGHVARQCLDDGNWSDANWATCGYISLFDEIATSYEEEKLEYVTSWISRLNGLTQLGYTISIVALIAALIIFTIFKKLHCERNKLHMNLFVSHILAGLSFYAKNYLFKDGHGLHSDLIVDVSSGTEQFSYTAKCKLLMTLYWYIHLSNFTLMLMEGVYLHNLIFFNFFSENHRTLPYSLFGWLTPLIFTISWSIYKLFFDDVHCWTTSNGYANYFIEIPTAVTVVVNFILFLMIIRVLVMKMDFTAAFQQEKRMKYRKLLKSTLTLIPIYGIPYIIVLITEWIELGTFMDVVIFCDHIFSSLQGLFAAIVYCLGNVEVREEIFRKYTTLQDHRIDRKFKRARTISTNTQQIYFQDSTDELDNLNLCNLGDGHVKCSHHCTDNA